MLLLGLTTVPNLAAEGPPASTVSGALSPHEQETFARWFAPRFVFHPDERYFPCSPLHPLETRVVKGQVQPTGPVGREGAVLEGETPVTRLGNPISRVEAYEQRPVSDKTAMSRVFFRAYPWRWTGQEVVVVEYWLYYVYSDYHAKAMLFRFSADASHPNDMEHVVLVLQRKPDRTGPDRASRRPRDYDVRSILASAHTAGIPDNFYDVEPGLDLSQHVPILVELGSHAMAPDINDDTRFDPDHDVTAATKMVWGIRDRGSTGSRYRDTFADSRRDGGIELTSDHAAPRSRPPDDRIHRQTYRLEPVQTLESRFDRLALSQGESDEAFGTNVGWLKRLFGKADGADASLVRPTDHTDYGAPQRMRNGHTRPFRGISTGVTNILSSHSFFVDARYGWPNASPILPDLTLGAQAILSGKGTDFYSVELLASYPIDVITRVFGGAGLLTDDIRFNTRQFDWITGFEVTLGRFRFRQAFRSTGPVNTSGWAEFRAEWKAW